MSSQRNLNFSIYSSSVRWEKLHPKHSQNLGEVEAPSREMLWRKSFSPSRSMSKPDGDPTLVDHSGIGVDIGGSFAKLVYFRYGQQTS